MEALTLPFALLLATNLILKFILLTYFFDKLKRRNNRINAATQPIQLDV